MKRLFLLTVLLIVTTHARAQPITWTPPDRFNPDKIGLGLPTLSGARHTVVYDPLPVEGDAYASTRHGLYNHHSMMLWVDDTLILYWTNHAGDENAPGQRILALTAIYDPQTDQLDWQQPPVELVPPVSALHTRTREAMPLDVDPRFALGNLHARGDSLLSEGRIALYWGWTDVPAMRQHNTDAIDAAHFSPGRTDRFTYDIRWITGPTYAQLWALHDGRLVPQTALHLDSPMPRTLQMTTNVTLDFPTPLPPFNSAPDLAGAPGELRAAWDEHRQHRPSQRYAPGAASLAADGPDALAHMSEFRRPDGSLVILRDNLQDPGHYYAAERPDEHSLYPPAQKTDLPGDVLPAAGELPDGQCFIVGNTLDRRTLYLTLSDDGRTFDRTWLLLYIDKPWQPGLGKSARGGPQYTQASVAHGSIWLVYSIGKQQIGVTQVPIAALDRAGP